MDELGIEDWLKENITEGMTTDQVHVKYAELMSTAKKRHIKWQRDQYLAQVEKAGNVAEAEGYAGVFHMLDQMVSDPAMMRLDNFHEYERIFSIRDTMKPDQWQAQYKMIRRMIHDDWRASWDNQKALIEGAMGKLGTEDVFGTRLGGSVEAEGTAWNDYFKAVDDDYNKFFRTEYKTYDARNAAWNELLDKHNALYVENTQKVLDLHAERDTMLVDAIASRYGDGVRATAEKWRGDVRAGRERMFGAMHDFWLEIRGLPLDEKNAAWRSFLKDDYSKQVRQNVVDSRTGANATYAAAANAERAGEAVPPERVAQAAAAPVRPKRKSGKEFVSEVLNEEFDFGGEIKTYAEIMRELQEAGGTPEQISLYMGQLVKNKARELATAVHRIDPVGDAAPGTVNGLYDKDIYAMFNEGWRENVSPLLREMEAQHTNPANAGKVMGADMTPEQARAVRQWAAGVNGKRGDAKLAAYKLGELGAEMAILDYDKRYGIDNIANMFIPYQFWYTRSGLNWALSAIDRPYWITNWYRMREMQEKYARPMPGFPSRLAGKMQIAMPFLPDGWGDTIYVDPLHQLFGFEGMLAQVTRPLQRDFSNRMSRAQYILYEMIESGEVTEAQAKDAMTKQLGELWDRAYKQATAEVDADIQSPMDLVNAMTSFSLPIQWALSRKAVRGALENTPLWWLAMGDKNRSAGTFPLVSTVQSLTSGMTPGGFNFVEKALQVAGGTGEGARGFLWDYYVARELSNMAANGADIEGVKLAMVDKQGPLYEQAVSTVGKQGALKQFSSLLWGDLFPEGEQQQRVLSLEFSKAADAGKLTEFFEKHPEYEARLQLNDWDDPEGMLRGFLKSSVWDAWYGMSDLEQEAARDQLDAQYDDLFSDAFMNRETRSYDSIDTQTMAAWARALKGVVPETAPQTPQMGIELPETSLSQGYAA
ncbi:MAG: hypothetical protein WC822_07485, partial [Candidatus Paceibacterota bacterium]